MSRAPILRSMAIVTACVMGIGCGGPAGGGNLAVRNGAQPWFVLRGDFGTGVYRHYDGNTLELVLMEDAESDAAQAVHIRMLWEPQPGLTPISRRSTNATVQYLIFTGRAAGIYEGAGFLFPKTEVGQNVFEGELRFATLRLQDHTPNFQDRLGAAEASGSFLVRHDPEAVGRALRRMRLRLRESLGYPRLVKTSAPAGPTLARNP